MSHLGVRLRPHLKTAKSFEIARLMMDSPQGPATVSTLQEAAQFAAAGVSDIIYAVGVTPAKLRAFLRFASRASILPSCWTRLPSRGGRRRVA
jgi:D-serine deaminase-like pyridoxal phosphate-dependent protein